MSIFKKTSPITFQKKLSNGTFVSIDIPEDQFKTIMHGASLAYSDVSLGDPDSSIYFINTEAIGEASTLASRYGLDISDFRDFLAVTHQGYGKRLEDAMPSELALGESFESELSALISKYRYDDQMQTPAPLMAAYLVSSLKSLEDAVKGRDIWAWG